MIIEFGTGHTGKEYVTFLAATEEEAAWIISLHHSYHRGNMSLKATDENGLVAIWEYKANGPS